MKQIGVVVMFLFASFLMSAQDANVNQKAATQQGNQQSAVEKRQAEELAKLSKQLSLTPAQKKSIVELQKNLNAATLAFREADKKDPQRKAKRDEMKKLRKAYEPSLIALLTPKQKKKYEAMKAAGQQEADKRTDAAVKQSSANMGAGEEGGEE